MPSIAGEKMLFEEVNNGGVVKKVNQGFSELF